MAVSSDKTFTVQSPNNSLLQDTDPPTNLVSTDDEGFSPVVGKKRRKPMDGHSPEDRNPPPHDPRSPEQREMLVRKSVSFDPGNAQIPTRTSGARFTFIVKATQPLDLGKITSIVSELLPDSTIIRHQLTAKGRIALFKTRNPSPNPDHDLNIMLRKESAKAILEKYGNSGTGFSVHHHDPTARQTVSQNNPMSKHVIATQVPTDYSRDYFHSEIKKALPNLAGNFESCHRIISSQSGKPTPLMRIICTEEVTATNLIQNGLKVGSVIYRCEKPHEMPPPIKRCFRCQASDHKIQDCSGTDVCAKCSGPHRTKECTKQREEYRCLECGERHAVWSCKKNLRPDPEPVRGGLPLKPNPWTQTTPASSMSIPATSTPLPPRSRPNPQPQPTPSNVSPTTINTTQESLVQNIKKLRMEIKNRNE